MRKKPKTAVQIANEIEQDRINKLWWSRLGDAAGQELIADLKRNFEARSPLKRIQDGSIDVNQTLANCGALEVLSFIDQRIELGSLPKTEETT